MPSKAKDVFELFQRLTKLEERVANLTTFQKWEMGLLAAIILMLLKVVLKA